MIDYTKSSELNGMTEDELRSWFVRYPKSCKRIIAACDGCGKERDIEYKHYRGLCGSCTSGLRWEDPDQREVARVNAIKQFSTQEARDDQSDRRKAYLEDSQHLSDMLYNTRKSGAWDESMKLHRGGMDICNHHIAYDFNRPKAMIVRITRKFHAAIHHPPGIGIHQRGYSLID